MRHTGGDMKEEGKGDSNHITQKNEVKKHGEKHREALSSGPTV